MNNITLERLKEIVSDENVKPISAAAHGKILDVLFMRKGDLLPSYVVVEFSTAFEADYHRHFLGYPLPPQIAQEKSLDRRTDLEYRAQAGDHMTANFEIIPDRDRYWARADIRHAYMMTRDPSNSLISRLLGLE